MKRSALTLWPAIGLLAGPAYAEDTRVTWGGDVTVSQRLFSHSPLLPTQDNRMQFAETTLNGKAEFSDSLKLEWDVQAGTDGEPYYDIEVAKLSGKAGAFRYAAGADTVYWAKTEIAKLSNIVNQEDWRRGTDTDDRRGRPMLSLSWQGDAGLFEGFYFPYAPERAFPDRDARLRTLLPFTGDAVYESGQGAWQPSFAGRWSRHFGAFDFGAYGYYGTASEPGAAVRVNGASPFVPSSNPLTPGQLEERTKEYYDRLSSVIPGAGNLSRTELQQRLRQYYRDSAPLIPEFAGLAGGSVTDGLADYLTLLAPYYPAAERFGSGLLALTPDELRQFLPQLAPYYALTTQAGADLQYTKDAFALKAEARQTWNSTDLRFTRCDVFNYAVGLEYNFYELGGSPVDMTLITEYTNDSRGRAALTPLQNDIAVGARWRRNGTDATQLDLFYVRDVDFGTEIVQMELTSNITDHFKIGLNYQQYRNVGASDLLLLGMQGDENIRLSLTYAF